MYFYISYFQVIVLYLLPLQNLTSKSNNVFTLMCHANSKLNPKPNKQCRVKRIISLALKITASRNNGYLICTLIDIRQTVQYICILLFSIWRIYVYIDICTFVHRLRHHYIQKYIVMSKSVWFFYILFLSMLFSPQILVVH